MCGSYSKVILAIIMFFLEYTYKSNDYIILLFTQWFLEWFIKSYKIKDYFQIFKRLHKMMNRAVDNCFNLMTDKNICKHTFDGFNV